ncbi:hypothetical protein [Nocardia sp. NPDC051832]|uniref:hypothetical protein n=1 Tax=Nocardia sp. NPDC051832 TaxID=3155673 RepID=UPI00343644FB
MTATAPAKASTCPMAVNAAGEALRLEAADAAAFMLLLRKLAEWSGRSKGQIHAVSKMPRSTTYWWLHPENESLPKSRHRLEDFCRACKLGEAGVAEVMRIWERLNAAQQRVAAPNSEPPSTAPAAAETTLSGFGDSDPAPDLGKQYIRPVLAVKVNLRRTEVEPPVVQRSWPPRGEGPTNTMEVTGEDGPCEPDAGDDPTEVPVLPPPRRRRRGPQSTLMFLMLTVIAMAITMVSTLYLIEPSTDEPQPVSLVHANPAVDSGAGWYDLEPQPRESQLYAATDFSDDAGHPFGERSDRDGLPGSHIRLSVAAWELAREARCSRLSLLVTAKASLAAGSGTSEGEAQLLQVVGNDRPILTMMAARQYGGVLAVELRDDVVTVKLVDDEPAVEQSPWSNPQVYCEAPPRGPTS